MYSMDAVLQNFRRSFGPTTPFFQSMSLDPLVTMEELYRRADKFSMLEDNIRATSQTIMITAQNKKPAAKGPFQQKRDQGKNQKHPAGQSEKKRDPPPPSSPLSTLPMIDSCPSFGTSLTLNGHHQRGPGWTNVIGPYDATITGTTTMKLIIASASSS